MDNNIGNRAIHNQRMSGYKRDIFHTNGQTFESPYYGNSVKRFTIGGDYYKGKQITPDRYVYGEPNSVWGNRMGMDKLFSMPVSGYDRTVGQPNNRRYPQQPVKH